MKGRDGVIFSEGSASDWLKRIIEDLEEIQDRVAELSDELDEDMLEEAEGEIDVMIDRIGDVIKKHGWKVKKPSPLEMRLVSLRCLDYWILTAEQLWPFTTRVNL